MSEKGPYKVGYKLRINYEGNPTMDIGVEFEGIMKNPVHVDLLQSEATIDVEIKQNVAYAKKKCDEANERVRYAMKLLEKLGVQEDQVL